MQFVFVLATKHTVDIFLNYPFIFVLTIKHNVSLLYIQQNIQYAGVFGI